MKMICISLTCLAVLAVTFCSANDNPFKGKNVVYLGGEMNEAPADWVGKNVTDILPKSEIQKIVILRSMSSAPLSLHEAAVSRLWTVPVRTIKVEKPPLDSGAWFDAVVVLKSGDHVRVTFWNECARYVTEKGIGFFELMKLYVQQPDRAATP